VTNRLICVTTATKGLVLIFGYPVKKMCTNDSPSSQNEQLFRCKSLVCVTDHIMVTKAK